VLSDSYKSKKTSGRRSIWPTAVLNSQAKNLWEMMSAGQLLNISKIQKRDSFCTFFGKNTVFVHIVATWFKFSNVFFLFFYIFSLQKSIVNLLIQIMIFHKIDYLYNNMLCRSYSLQSCPEHSMSSLIFILSHQDGFCQKSSEPSVFLLKDHLSWLTNSALVYEPKCGLSQ
jgi:hypothetical protein